MAPKSIKKAEDLVTPHEEVCAGFLAQARSKNAEAKPYLTQAVKFWNAIEKLERPEDVATLYTNPEYREELLAAAGYSKKSLGNLRKLFSEDEMTDLLRQFFETGFDAASFKSEIYARYLLTKGDSLGGTMRNVIGAQGKERFKNALIAALERRKLSCEIKEYKGRVRGIEWITGRKIQVTSGAGVMEEREEKRMIVFDATPRQLGIVAPDIAVEEVQVEAIMTDAESLDAMPAQAESTDAESPKDESKKNNVDIIVLDSTHELEKKRRKTEESKASFERRRNNLFKNPKNYLASGELKSGIDPAGADEHFKTAGSAIGRLRERFAEHGINLPLFIVAAAVARAMAGEIYADLQSGVLSYAANFTNSQQLEELADWVVSL